MNILEYMIWVSFYVSTIALTKLMCSFQFEHYFCAPETKAQVRYFCHPFKLFIFFQLYRNQNQQTWHNAVLHKNRSILESQAPDVINFSCNKNISPLPIWYVLHKVGGMIFYDCFITRKESGRIRRRFSRYVGIQKRLKIMYR